MHISIDGVAYQFHRVVYAIHHGAWPELLIDHIDGDRLNNRPENLRDVPDCINKQNLQRGHRDSKSGTTVPGVTWNKKAGKFVVKGKLSGRYWYAGSFDAVADAENAALAFRRSNYPGSRL